MTINLVAYALEEPLDELDELLEVLLKKHKGNRKTALKELEKVLNA